MEPLFLPLADVRTLTGLSTSTIYRRMAAGKFPAARRLSNQKVGWLRSEIDEWAASLPVADPADHFAPKRKTGR